MLSGIVLVALIVGGLYAFFAWYSSNQFKGAYQQYERAQESYVTAAYKPAADSNPVRQSVNVLLAQVLQVEMTPAVRLEKAKQGIAHLNDMEGQIDAIKTEADTVMPLLNALDNAASSVGNVTQRQQTQELVKLGHRQVEIIADIRGLSYRADYYTDEVFERIIDDQGAMTDAHKQYLNELIPQLEEQFNKRTNLYAELKKNDDAMKKIAEELGYSAEQ
jgi:hypothetical protein